jgi:hypothetical protein
VNRIGQGCEPRLDLRHCGQGPIAIQVQMPVSACSLERQDGHVSGAIAAAPPVRAVFAHID